MDKNSKDNKSAAYFFFFLIPVINEYHLTIVGTCDLLFSCGRRNNRAGKIISLLFLTILYLKDL